MGTYVLCALLETICVVKWNMVIPVPRQDTDIGKSIRLFPCFAHGFCTCKVLQLLWVHKVIEVFVILELLNLTQLLLSAGVPVVVHIICFPFLRVLVTVRDQATVVRILKQVLQTEKQFFCRPLPHLLVF